MALEATVGARLSIQGAAAAVKNLAKFNAELERTNALLDKTKESSLGTIGAMGGVSKAAEDKAAATGKALTAEQAAAAGMDAATVSALKQNEAVKELEKSHKSLGKTIADVGNGPLGTFGEWVTGGAVAVAIESMTKYAQLQNQYMKLFTLAGVPKNSINGIMQGGMQISKDTGVNFTDVANQLYRIASANAGLHQTNRELLDLGRQAANLAVLFNQPSGAPSELLGRLYGNLSFAARPNSQGTALQGVGNAKHITELMAATVGAADIQPQDLISAMSRGLIQSGQAVGARLPDMLAWIALSTKLGANATTTGTLISHSLQQLATPSAQGAKSELMFGVPFGQLHELISQQGLGKAASTLIGSIMGGLNPPGYYPAFGKNAPGLQSVLAQLAAWGLAPDKIAQLQGGFGLNPQQLAYVRQTGTFAPGESQAQMQAQKDALQFIFTKAFGGARQEIPWLTLAENQGAFGSTLKYIMANTNDKKFNSELSAAMNTPQRQLEIAKKNVEYYGLELGKAITPDVMKGVHAFVDVMKVMADHSSVFLKIGESIAALAAIGMAAKVWSKAFGPASALGGYIRRTNLKLHAPGIKSKAAGILASLDQKSPEGAAAAGQMNAAEMQMRAAELQLEAVKRGAFGGAGYGLGKGKGGLGGLARTAEGEASSLESGALGGAEGAALGAGEKGALGGLLTFGGLDLSALAGPIGIAAAMAAPFAMPYITKGLGAFFHSFFSSSGPSRNYVNPAQNYLNISNSTRSQMTETINNLHNGALRPNGPGWNPKIDLSPTSSDYVKNAERYGTLSYQHKQAAFYAAMLSAHPALQIPLEEKDLKHLQYEYSHLPVGGRGGPGAARSMLSGQMAQIQATINRQKGITTLMGKTGISTYSPAVAQLQSAQSRSIGDIKAAGDSLKAAGDKHTTAAQKYGLTAAALNTAAQDSKQAGIQQKEASKSTGDAAKAHQTAAKMLQDAANALTQAAGAIKSGNSAAVANAVSAVTQAAKNANARG